MFNRNMLTRCRLKNMLRADSQKRRLSYTGAEDLSFSKFLDAGKYFLPMFNRNMLTRCRLKNMLRADSQKRRLSYTGAEDLSFSKFFCSPELRAGKVLCLSGIKNNLRNESVFPLAGDQSTELVYGTGR